MAEILAALSPIFLIIVLGYLLRRFSFVPDAFWVPAEKIVFYVFFPALLFRNIARAELAGIGAWPMLAAGAAAIVLVVVVLLLTRPWLKQSGPAFAAIVQGTIRPNVYIGIAATAALFGENGLTLISLCIALLIPLVNLIGVIALVRWGDGGSKRWIAALGAIARNPIILACLAGFASSLANVQLPIVADSILEILGRASLPLALLSVGASLEFAALRQVGAVILTTTAVKLVALPLVTIGFCHLFGVEGLPLIIVAVLFVGLPVSPSAYVMTRRMGGDARLLAGVVTASTIAAAVTLPMFLLILT